MKLNPYLTFDGCCRAAFEYYEKSLGGKIIFLMTYGESPMAGETPAEWHGKVLHASLAVGEQVLGGADVLPDRYRKPQGFAVTLNLSDAPEADRIFQALAENGDVQMPLQETFWALRFGVLVDQFGTPWMIDCAS